MWTLIFSKNDVLSTVKVLTKLEWQQAAKWNIQVTTDQCQASDTSRTIAPSLMHVI
jgi:hypothetical protein